MTTALATKTDTVFEKLTAQPEDHPHYKEVVSKMKKLLDETEDNLFHLGDMLYALRGWHEDLYNTKMSYATLRRYLGDKYKRNWLNKLALVAEAFPPGEQIEGWTWHLLRGVPNGTRVPFSLHLPWHSPTCTSITECRWRARSRHSLFREARTGIGVQGQRTDLSTYEIGESGI